MQALAFVFALVTVVLPSKQAESESIRTAHKTMERLSGLSERQQYDRFLCQVWFYESLNDRSNFAKLSEKDKDALKKIVGDRAFFLHRFTPKGKNGAIYEVFIADDGKTVRGSRMKPKE